MLRSTIALLLGGALLALTACTPTDNPNTGNDRTTASGVVRLPAGYSIPLAELKVVDVYGAGAAVASANGGFSALVPTNGMIQLDLLDASGKLMMMGQVGPDGGEISPTQTAIILVFYALGGFTAPPENHAALMEMIAADPAVATFAQVVESRLAANPAALADGDDELIAALRTARDALFPTASAKIAPFGLSCELGGAYRVLADAGTLMTIEPATAQSGIELLQNSSSSGLLAQNSFRRYAAFLAYQTATEDAAGVKTTLSSPQFVGPVHDIPSTSRLEFFSAITDLFTGHAPFEPVRTAPVDLPLATGSVKTYYDVIALGPAIESVYPPVFQDTRYFPYTEEWNTQLDRLRFKMFWLDFAWPALETFLFVRGAGAQQEKLDEFVTEFKTLCDKRLLNLGVVLRSQDPREGGLVVAMNLLLNALKEETFRLEFVNGCKKALSQSALNQANFESMSSKLSGRAAAASITAAIQIALEIGDIYKVVSDIAASRSGEVWNVAVVAPPVRLDPNPATVTLNQPSVSLIATVQGTVSASFVYRWTTTGQHGTISDVGEHQGVTFVTTRGTVLYLANVGAIVNGSMDTVTVEVYQDDGSGTISAASVYLGKVTAQINGVRDDEGGPVTLETYPHNKPEIDDGCLLTAQLEADSVPNGAFSLKWTTSGNHGTLEGNRTEVEGVDVWSLFYNPNEDAQDGETDWVRVEITRIADGSPVGHAEAIMDIWNPKTIYALCGDTAGQLPPYLGSGTSWGFYVVDHGPWMGADFYARPGDQVQAYLTCSYGRCDHDLGPVYIRRGALGTAQDVTVLIASQGHYGCTPPQDESCTMVDVTITLP
jgi:hypothetical protein